MQETDALIEALIGRYRKQHEWEGEIEGYTVNFLKKQWWKIKHTTPWEDAMQEAYVVFLRCKRRYPGVEPKHFMALYKTSWSRHFINLAIEDTKQRSVVQEPETEAVEFERIGETDNDGVLATMIRQAPNEVRMVLGLLLNAPQDMLAVLLAGWKVDPDQRATHKGSKRINELLGLPPEQDTMGMVRSYFE